VSGDWKAGLVEHVPGEARGLRTGAPGPRSSRSHDEQRRVSTGLDWDALRPRCTACGQPSMDVQLSTGLCPLCRAVTTGPTNAPAAAPAPEKRKTRRTTVPPAGQAEIVRRYAAGENSGDLAAEFRCSPSTVLNLVRDAGVTVRARGGHPRTGGAA
jgi:hypothetical protein